MTSSHSIKFNVKGISLGWYTEDEITALSSTEVTHPASFDMFGHPVPEGPYDLHMGPLSMEQTCKTCSLGYLSCPGHFGHYRLSRPVLNPLCFDIAYSLFRSCCLNCFHFKITSGERISFYTKLKVIRKGIPIATIESFIQQKTVDEIQKELDEIDDVRNGYENTTHFDLVNLFLKKNSAKTTCPRCHFKSPKFKKAVGMKILREGQNGMSDFVNPGFVRDGLCKLFKNENALTTEMFSINDPGKFFMSVIPIMPNKFRPANYIGEKVSECHLNSHIAKVINNSVMTENDESAWSALQGAVLAYFDSSKSPTATYPGHKQLIEKKEGLFRKNIMGKRVNYAARSVISPDPTLETREVGIPLIFASQLTFPEKVTSFNFEKLRKMVINGEKYPGANFVQSNGALINLKYISYERRMAIANQLMEGEKTVWRHLLDQDPLLMNRQPTLHSVSLMGHLAKVLKNEKTLRLHYTNCKSYNADFDGDEMNIHFPQDFNSLSEIYNLALNDNSYFAPSSGEPIRGLTQDHIIAATFLTMKDSFFTKEEFHSIIDHAISNLSFKERLLATDRLQFTKPCILSPAPLYSGKQIVSTILKNFNITINFTVKSKLPFPDGESIFSIFRGELITGVLDKASVGASTFSLIHACGEIYGYAICNDLLTVFSRMVNRYMIIKGLTVRYDDLLLDQKMDAERTRVFSEGNSLAIAYQMMGCPDNFTEDSAPQSIFNAISTKAAITSGSTHPLFGTEDFYFDQEKVSLLDKKMRGFMNSIATKISTTFEGGMFKKFPNNNMANIILSGSKGSMVNLGQILALLGQQELEGKRVPFMASGKTLPCFRRLELSPAAGGFVFERFLTGVNPATYFFHCMAGREGLIDTAVKTANSGYLQRCLAKHLEGIYVRNDGKVMHGDRIIQFRFGDDGLDIARSSYLNNLDFYSKNLELFKKTGSGNIKEGREKVEEISDLYAIPESYKKVIESHSSDELKSFMASRYIDSRVNSGHSVGVIAAQSIGEPSTQMTLNTFHLAGVGGKNVTLGIPRLREILMTASKNMKTPMITIPVFEQEEAEEIAGLFKRVTLEDVLKTVTVEEKMVEKDLEYKKHIRITFELRDHVEAAVKAIDTGFLKLLGKELKKRSSPTGITECNETASQVAATEEEAKEEPEDEEESSTESSKTEEEKIKYEPEEEEMSQEESAEQEIKAEEEEEEDTDEEPCNLLNLRKVSSKKYTFDIYYPADFNILLLPIIEGIAQKVVVKQIPGFSKGTASGTLLYLDGSDFRSLTGIVNGVNLLEKMDIYNALSNDIYAIYQTFGVEAAREVIVREVNTVFEAYGIKVNVRHLYLVADYMTRDGTFKAFSRHSFTMDDCFVQKMSFESCFLNLKNSAIFGQRKEVESPSSCLLTGSLLRNGTGCFELLYDLRHFEEV